MIETVPFAHGKRLVLRLLEHFREQPSAGRFKVGVIVDVTNGDTVSADPASRVGVPVYRAARVVTVDVRGVGGGTAGFPRGCDKYAPEAEAPQTGFALFEEAALRVGEEVNAVTHPLQLVWIRRPGGGHFPGPVDVHVGVADRITRAHAGSPCRREVHVVSGLINLNCDKKQDNLSTTRYGQQ